MFPYQELFLQSVPIQAETSLRLLAKPWLAEGSRYWIGEKACVHLTKASFHAKQIAKEVLSSRTILEVKKIKIQAGKLKFVPFLSKSKLYYEIITY